MTEEKKGPPKKDYVVHGPPEMQQTEVSVFLWEFSSTKLHTTPNHGYGDNISPQHLSDTYKLGSSINKSSSWRLVMNPSHIENGIQYMSLYLWMCSLDPSVEHVDVIYLFQIFESHCDSVVHAKQSGIRRFTKESPSFGWTKFISCIELGTKPPEVIRLRARVVIYSDPMPLELPQMQTPYTPGPYCREDFLKAPPLVFYDPNITKNNPGTSKSVQIKEMSPEEIEQEHREDKIRKHVASLWISKSHSDAQVIVKGRIIPVHASVLKAKSSIFCEHFSQLDSEGKRVTDFRIDDIDKEVVEAALEFCYTKMITKVFANLDRYFDLLEAAEKLSINGLKDFAKQMIFMCINVDNFERVYNMMAKDRLEEGEEYSMGQFFKLLLELRKNNPKLLSDYSTNVAAYASFIFK